MQIKKIIIMLLCAMASPVMKASQSWIEFKQDIHNLGSAVKDKVRNCAQGLIDDSKSCIDATRQEVVADVNSMIPAFNASDVAIYSFPAWLTRGFYNQYKQQSRDFSRDLFYQQPRHCWPQVIKYTCQTVMPNAISTTVSNMMKKTLPRACIASYVTGFAWHMLRPSNQK